MASKVYDFTIAAGASQRLDVRGSFFKLLSSTASPHVVKSDTGEEWIVRPGQGFRMLVRDTNGFVLPFGALTIRNPSPTAIAVGTCFIGEAAFDDSRITGDVSIVDAIGTGCQLYIAAVLTVGFNTTPLIAAASNVNGIIIRQSAIESNAGAGGTVNSRIIAAPTAPANIFPTGVPAIVLNSINNITPGVFTNSFIFDSRRFVPPGWGIHYCNNVTVAAAAACSEWISAEIL